jgi:integrase
LERDPSLRDPMCQNSATDSRTIRTSKIHRSLGGVDRSPDWRTPRIAMERHRPGRGTLSVTATVYDGHFDTPKTQRSDRVIPIGDEASSVLQASRHAEVKQGDLVFSTCQGRPLNRHNMLRRALRLACDKLGLHGITWHSLRHSHATLLDAVGAPLGTVQALLGHSAAEIMREVDLHAVPEDQRKAVAGG